MKHVLKSLCAVAVALAASGWMEAKAQKVTFYTPRTVRIEKPQSGDESRSSLVVIAEPGKVKVRESVLDGAKVYRSSALTVTVKDGKVTFADNKGAILTTEGATVFTPIEQGPDKGKFRVKLKSTLIKKARGFNYEERKIIKKDGVVVREEIYVRASTPDVGAIHLLLKNYDEDWANEPQALALKKEELELQKLKLKEW